MHDQLWNCAIKWHLLLFINFLWKFKILRLKPYQLPIFRKLLEEYLLGGTVNQSSTELQLHLQVISRIRKIPYGFLKIVFTFPFNQNFVMLSNHLRALIASKTMASKFSVCKTFCVLLLFNTLTNFHHIKLCVSV